MEVFKYLLLISAFSLLANAQDRRFKAEFSARKNLREAINKRVDRVLGPVGYWDPLVVTFGMTLDKLMAVDSRNQVITVNAWILQTWTHPVLKWSPRRRNVTKTRFSIEEVWVPDTALFNNGEKAVAGRQKFFESSDVIMTYDGKAKWRTYATLTNKCKLNAKFWPMDEHVCTLTFSSRRYTASEMKIQSDTTNEHATTDHLSNSEWDVIKITVKTGNVDDFSAISYSIHIRRKPQLLLLMFFTPSAILFIMGLVFLAIPSKGNNRVVSVTLVLVAKMAILMVLCDYVPHSPEELPNIVVLLVASIVCIAALLIATIIIKRGPACLCPNKKAFFTCRSKAKVIPVMPAKAMNCDMKGVNKDIERAESVTTMEVTDPYNPDKQPHEFC
ncbi:predicted protein [Nematostella vectensis]|uniref:Neurotransmitter-gated ion-channel ligand-binding domain-containing protein n=1 Tax=Nematostella vectensis TaxID=45351 RepID=A7RTX5_NEMVE|nr:predicted protein [Nematostella vectensis]|eukprot:XP_001637170.1 predicted protein [Nematostella vectensis]